MSGGPVLRRAGLALAGLGWALQAAAVQDCDIAGVSVNPANGATTAGKTGLMRCVERDTGQVQREQELRDGRYVGLVRFYERGKLLKEHSVNDQGNLQGVGREFGPQGQVVFEGTYDNGQLRGLARRFHPNGKLRRVSFHGTDREPQAAAEFNAEGQLTELRCAAQPQLAPHFDDRSACGFAKAPSRLEFFSDKGILKARGAWQEGRRIRFETLDEQGRPRATEEIDGARSIEREFDAAGVKRRERERVTEGRETASDRLRLYSETGTLTREQQWQRGRPVRDAQFFLNGQPRRTSEWSWDSAFVNATVSETEHRDDGGVAATGRWIETRGRRQPTGTHQRFNTARRLVGESTYDDRGRLVRERAWDDAGTLLRDDAVFEDGSRKAYAR